MIEEKICECCGAKLVEYTHRLNVGLCDALLTLYRAGGKSKIADLHLTKSQYCNFQKLKYWGLIVKANSENDDKGGQWEITHEGIEFVEGGQISEYAITFRGTVVRSDGEKITMKSVVGEYDFRPWYALHSRPVNDFKQQKMNF